MQHMFFLNKKDILAITDLLNMKSDGVYYVLTTEKHFCDIAQYCEKYDNVKLVTVHDYRLDLSKEYMPR